MIMKEIWFYPEESRKWLGDEIASSIELKARNDADNKIFDPPKKDYLSASWATGVDQECKLTVYKTQYEKRLQRNERKNNNTRNVK